MSARGDRRIPQSQRRRKRGLKEGGWRDQGKGECYTRTNSNGGSYTVCEGSKGQQGVYVPRKDREDPDQKGRSKDKAIQTNRGVVRKYDDEGKVIQSMKGEQQSFTAVKKSDGNVILVPQEFLKANTTANAGTKYTKEGKDRAIKKAGSKAVEVPIDEFNAQYRVERDGGDDLVAGEYELQRDKDKVKKLRETKVMFEVAKEDIEGRSQTKAIQTIQTARAARRIRQPLREQVGGVRQRLGEIEERRVAERAERDRVSAEREEERDAERRRIEKDAERRRIETEEYKRRKEEQQERKEKQDRERKWYEDSDQVKKDIIKYNKRVKKQPNKAKREAKERAEQLEGYDEDDWENDYDEEAENLEGVTEKKKLLTPLYKERNALGQEAINIDGVRTRNKEFITKTGRRVVRVVLVGWANPEEELVLKRPREIIHEHGDLDDAFASADLRWDIRKLKDFINNNKGGSR